MTKRVDKPPEPRRGRIPQSTYVQTIGKMLTRDWWALEKCEILTQLDIVPRLCEKSPKKYPYAGFAVRALLDAAIDQVIEATMDSANNQTKRIAYYLGFRMDGKSVEWIAKSWGLTREYVTRSIGHQAMILVTERVLRLGRPRPVPVEKPTPEPVVQPPVFIMRRTGFRKDSEESDGTN